MSTENPSKYLRNITRAEEVIALLNDYLRVQKAAEMVFYPVFIEEIMDLLIDMKNIIEEYAIHSENLEAEIQHLQQVINNSR
jgi:hypothetical protein